VLHSIIKGDETYLETLAELGLLLVYYTESEVDLVGLLKVRLHLHDLGKCLFGMFQGSVAIIQNTDAVPEFRLLNDC
jgi:hypothetical protein